MFKKNKKKKLFYLKNIFFFQKILSKCVLALKLNKNRYFIVNDFHLCKIVSVRCIESNDILTVKICWANKKLQVLNVPFFSTDGLMDRKTKKNFALNDQKCHKTCRKHVFSNLEKKNSNKYNIKKSKAFFYKTKKE